MLSAAGIARSDPPFRVVYLAEDLVTAAYETLIRGRFDLKPMRVLSPVDYNSYVAVNISSTQGNTITVVDLMDGNAIRHGVPSDVTSYSKHTDGQHFAEFVHANMHDVDGVLYRSRFTDRPSIAVYSRGIHRLVHGTPLPLNRQLLGPALQSWNVDVI